MVNRDHSVMLLVDIQVDFLPGGALAVNDSERILEPLYMLMESEHFKYFVATQDWHPKGHVSFASSHSGRKPFDQIQLYGHIQTLWPDHCVQGKSGARLYEELPWNKVRAVVRKGMDPEVDSYSGFRNNWNPSGQRPPTGLSGYLKELKLDTVFIVGLARDVCVKYSAIDAAAAGFDTYVLWDLTRPVDPGSDNDVRDELLKQRVKIIESQQIINPAME